MKDFKKISVSEFRSILESGYENSSISEEEYIALKQDGVSFSNLELNKIKKFFAQYGMSISYNKETQRYKYTENGLPVFGKVSSFVSVNARSRTLIIHKLEDYYFLLQNYVNSNT
jgi:hypothetical protein